MKSRVKYEAVATIGRYKDRTTGGERKHYQKVGTVFESEDGRLSLKLDTLPVGPQWSGYLSFFEPRPRDARSVPGHGGRSADQNGAPPPPDVRAEDVDDDIPF